MNFKKLIKLIKQDFEFQYPVFNYFSIIENIICIIKEENNK